MTVFWVVALCSLAGLETFKRYLMPQGDRPDDGGSNTPEDSHLHTRCRENLKSYHKRKSSHLEPENGSRKRNHVLNSFMLFP
jgi:hypothetical protein